MQYVNARHDLEADVGLGADTPVMNNAEAGVVTEKNLPDIRSTRSLNASFSSSPPSAQLFGELDYFAVSAFCFLAKSHRDFNVRLCTCEPIGAHPSGVRS